MHLDTVAEMKQFFEPAFTPQQSELLANGFYRYFEPLVTKREMAELRSVVADVAESQKRLAAAQERTEARVEEVADIQKRLAAAQERTEERMDRLAAAQERTEGRMDRLAAAQERTEERMDRLAAAQERTEGRMDRLAAAQEQAELQIVRLTTSQEEMREDIKDLVKVTKEVVWGLGDLRKQVGGIAMSVGQGLEAYAMERIPALLEKHLGFTTQSAMPEEVGPPGQSAEIDVVYRGMHEGRQVVVLCEVKTNITDREVADFLARVDAVRGSIGIDDVRVLFFGYRAGQTARRLIAEYGCWLAFPRGIVTAGENL